MKRIYTFIARFGYPMDAVVNKIKTDEMFAAHFTKEPRRTSLHGNLALEWLKETDVIREIEKLPSSGEAAVDVTSDGEIRAGMLNAPSKSLDFRWRSGRHTIYASHKFTKEGGGNQDSQFKEVKRLLEMFQKGRVDRHTALLVIVDGPYFTKKKIDELRRFCRDVHQPLSAALPIQDVPGWLEDNCAS